MANTHDYSIANDTGSAVRTDLNTLFTEIEAANAGASAPTNTAEGKLWYDTGNNVYKMYDGSAWVAISAKMDAVSAASGGTFTGAVTLPSPVITGTPTGITAAHLEAGVLPSDVTGGSGLTALGTVTAGTLGSAVNLNHDAKKHSWHTRVSTQASYSNAVVDFQSQIFLGDNTESAGRITVETSGLYWVSFTANKAAATTEYLDLSIRINTTVILGTRVYAPGGAPNFNGGSGSWAIPITAGQIIDVFGYGDIYDSMSFFSGTRIGAIS
jgi:hypothetical protein